MNYKKANCILNQLQEELLELAIQNVGKGQFAEDTFEEIQAQEQNEQEDFGFEEEDGQAPQQETQLFRKSIGLGPEKRPNIDQRSPELRVQGYHFVYGYNSGHRTVELVKNNLCRAVGVNLFYQNRIYFQHNLRITFLSYNNHKDILISGTEGKSAEIMLWRCKNQAGKYTFEPFFNEKQTKLLHLPLNSLGVGFAWLSGQNFLAVVTKFNLHQNSILYLFDLTTGKRSRCDIKLQKVVQICHNQTDDKVILLTEKGLSSLQISLEGQVKCVRVVEEQMITAIQMLAVNNSLFLLAGKLDGSLLLISAQQKSIVFSTKMHQKYVKCLKLINNQGTFLSLGRDNILNINEINTSNMSINLLQSIDTQELCVYALVNKNTIFCFSKAGKIIEFICENNQKYKRIQNKPDQQLIYNFDQKMRSSQTWIYDKYSKKYIYSISVNKEIMTLSIDHNKQFSAIKRFALSYPPFAIDIVGNIAAYIYRETKSTSKPTETTLSKFQASEVTAEYLILQDYTCHQLLTEVILDLAGCTKLKLSAEGDKLAAGFQNGKIVIFDVNKPKEIVKLKESQHHAKAIQSLIWSRDNKYLKTISNNHLLYYDLQKKGEQMTPLFSSKSIKDAEWSEAGKFDWRNSNLWQDHAHTVDQIKDIKLTKSYQLVIMQNGKLKVFRNPASKKGQQLCRLFNKNYHLQLLQDKQSQLTILVMGEGIIFDLEIKEGSEEAQQKEDEGQSFEQIDD